jgi:hypothetical protein
MGGGGGFGGGTRVMVKRPTAVMGVRPATVFSREQLVWPLVHVVMSQSQSHEWPVTSSSMSSKPRVGASITAVLSWLAQSKKVQSSARTHAAASERACNAQPRVGCVHGEGAQSSPSGLQPPMLTPLTRMAVTRSDDEPRSLRRISTVNDRYGVDGEKAPGATAIEP